MKIPLLPLIKFGLGWPLSLLALFFIYRLIAPHSASLWQKLADINIPILFLGLICFTSYFFLRAIAWHELIKEKIPTTHVKESLYIWGFAELHRYIPGTIWSLLGRTQRYTKKGIAKKDIVSFLGFEIIIMIISASWVSLLGISFLYKLLSFSLIPQDVVLTLTFILLSLVTLLLFYNAALLKKIPHKLLFLSTIPNSQITKKMIFLTILAFFAFGLGNYFTIASIVFLSPKDILGFIGFFSFSLLIGYLSIITPVGLGVREGILTLGLSSFFQLSLAGFLGIFSRVVLIAAEFLFLLIVFVWYRVKTNSIEHFITVHRYPLLLGFFIMLYMAYFIPIIFMRYDNFYTGRFDLGNMDQTVWNTSQGRLFQLTDPNGTQIISRLAFHADFILVLLAPLYLLWSDPRMLLLIQTIVVAFGAVFVYLLATLILGNRKAALVLAGAYLLNPSVQYANLFDFHAVTLATTFLLATFYFFLKKRYLLFLLFGILSAITKEQVWIILACFGLYVYIQKFFFEKNGKQFFKKWQAVLPLSLIVFCISIFYFLIWYAIPQAKGSDHFALEYYSEFGSSPTGIVKNIIFSPLKTLQIVFMPSRLLYLQQILIPLGFLPLFSPLLLLFVIPDLIINLLSNNVQLHQIYFQYTTTIVPFLFIATIFTIQRITHYFPKITPTVLSFFVLCSTLYSAYAYGPLPGAKLPNLDMITRPVQNKEFINDTLSQISQDFSIAATNNLGSHLSHRQRIFTIPNGMEEADIIAFLLDDPFAQPSPQAHRAFVAELRKNNKYILVVEKDNFIVFKRVAE